jgi:hypothetical protein
VTTMTHSRRAASHASSADSGSDRLCQHEFGDSSVCAADTVPGSTRCASHQDDGQPDLDIVEPVVESAVEPATGSAYAAGMAGAR